MDIRKLFVVQAAAFLVLFVSSISADRGFDRGGGIQRMPAQNYNRSYQGRNYPAARDYYQDRRNYNSGYYQGYVDSYGNTVYQPYYYNPFPDDAADAANPNSAENQFLQYQQRQMQDNN